jgi:hypothetical protein
MVCQRVRISGGECFWDAVLCNLADVKRRVWGLRERCRLAKATAGYAASFMEFSDDKNLASRKQSNNLDHLTESLHVSILP